MKARQLTLAILTTLLLGVGDLAAEARAPQPNKADPERTEAADTKEDPSVKQSRTSLGRCSKRYVTRKSKTKSGSTNA